jgi:glycosyltransferase involved in cell wall biosynthesis
VSARVGIILPARNAESTIKRSVDSVLDQTFKDFVLYCIVNGSGDNTKSILESYNDDRIRVLEGPVAGLVPALNFGLQSAGNELIARQDADDLWYPEKLQKQVEFLDTNPGIHVVGCQIRLVDANGKPNENQGNPYPTEDAGIRNSMLGGWNAIPHPGVVFRRELLLRTGGYDDTYHMSEDYYLWLRALKWFRFANLPEVLMDYTAVHNLNYDPRVVQLLWQAQGQIKAILSSYGR